MLLLLLLRRRLDVLGHRSGWHDVLCMLQRLLQMGTTLLASRLLLLLALDGCSQWWLLLLLLLCGGTSLSPRRGAGLPKDVVRARPWSAPHCSRARTAMQQQAATKHSACKELRQ